ncbi:MAG: hypothetical protein ACYSW3_21175 [Planctomycetota bacterium]|jgi:hypothetical protein
MSKKTITDISRLIVWIMLLMTSAASTASGQYEISWNTIDGGGGRSAGGQYELISTIGQPLLGGFLSGGPLCFVNFEHFARFAEHWLETGTGLPADLYEDKYNIVDELDLGVFVEEWLCYCPTGWPLK